jgi:urease accessory protein
MPIKTSFSRLLQLVSPSLPVGAYTYSQGIEWAVEEGWVSTQEDLCEWLLGLMQTGMRYLELPVFFRMLQAWEQGDELAIQKWSHTLIASRETLELRQEEINRARAFTRLLLSLQPESEKVEQLLVQSQHACLSYACHQWQVEADEAAAGLLWSWLENMVLSAVKIIPLGQTAGQMALFQLCGHIPHIIEQAKGVNDDDIGASSMALSIASSQHETLYTRLFRS